MKIVQFIFWLMPTFVFAQSRIVDINVDANYNNISFADFVVDFESKHGVTFFFNEQWVSNILMVQQKVPVSLNDLLNETFKDVQLYYYIDGNNIIITNNYQIVSALPAGYFNKTGTEVVNNSLNIAPVSFYESAKPAEVAVVNGISVVGNSSATKEGAVCVVSGKIKRYDDGSPIVGAVVYVGHLGKAAVTDASGYYYLNVPSGNHNLEVKCMGLEDIAMPVLVNGNGTLNVSMKEKAVLIKEVTVSTDKNNHVKNLSMGVQQLNMEEIKQLPTVLGEADIVKTVLLLPGVQTVGEGASGFNVRGGSADQNLVLIDEMPVFNTSHLFGFFSVFNPETIKDFKLYKSGIPAFYGGRVSSVLDVTAKQGNLKKHVFSGGISPVTGKLTAEGPIVKDKLSYIVGGRSTYSDWILKKINTNQFEKSRAGFYDVNCKLTYEINQKNFISFTGYQSEDNFKLNSDTVYKYENRAARLYYKHFFNPRTYAQASLIHSNYQYNITSSKMPETAFQLKYNIRYNALKTSVYYFPESKHSFSAGSELIRYSMTPGDFTPLSSISDMREIKLAKENGVEAGLFVNDDYKINSRLTVSMGVRYAMFFALGPYKMYHYNPMVPRSIDSRMDSTFYDANKVVKTYGGPEIRLSARYLLGTNNSVKLSYGRIHQFLHMLTNTTAISPTDVWKISDANIKPLVGDQFAVGYYHNLFENNVEASAEMYYKSTVNNLDYKNGAELLLNANFETHLLSGVGRAYGLELLLQKKQGILNGWMSYAYSKTELKVDGQFTEEKVNDGNFYPADYDKRHSFNLVANCRYSRRINVSNVFIYNTGRPITYPVAKYTFRGRQLLHYSNRNEYRIPDYLRWDMSITIYENFKSEKLIHNSFSVGVYNLLGVENVYSVFFKSTNSGIKGYKLSVFARPIFNVTYNFQF